MSSKCECNNGVLLLSFALQLRRLLCLPRSPPEKDALCSTRPISAGKVAFHTHKQCVYELVQQMDFRIYLNDFSPCLYSEPSQDARRLSPEE